MRARVFISFRGFDAIARVPPRPRGRAPRARALVPVLRADGDVGCGSHARARGPSAEPDQVDVRVAPPSLLPHPPPARASSRPPAHVRVFPPNPPPRLGRSYKRRQADFAALKEYNDYLETVEDIIFNLCEGNDVRATEARVDAYRRENAAEIARLNRRNAEEEARLRAAAPVAMDHSARDPTSDAWAPRRMSEASDLEDTPAATRTGGGAGGGRPRRDPPRAPPPETSATDPGGITPKPRSSPSRRRSPRRSPRGRCRRGGTGGTRTTRGGTTRRIPPRDARGGTPPSRARAASTSERREAKGGQEASQSLSCAQTAA